MLYSENHHRLSTYDSRVLINNQSPEANGTERKKEKGQYLVYEAS
jgi:hypothetical protein